MLQKRCLCKVLSLQGARWVLEDLQEQITELVSLVKSLEQAESTKYVQVSGFQGDDEEADGGHAISASVCEL